MHWAFLCISVAGASFVSAEHSKYFQKIAQAERWEQLASQMIVSGNPSREKSFSLAQSRRQHLLETELGLVRLFTKEMNFLEKSKPWDYYCELGSIETPLMEMARDMVFNSELSAEIFRINAIIQRICSNAKGLSLLKRANEFIAALESLKDIDKDIDSSSFDIRSEQLEGARSYLDDISALEKVDIFQHALSHLRTGLTMKIVSNGIPEEERRELDASWDEMVNLSQKGLSMESLVDLERLIIDIKLLESSPMKANSVPSPSSGKKSPTKKSSSPIPLIVGTFTGMSDKLYVTPPPLTIPLKLHVKLNVEAPCNLMNLTIRFNPDGQVDAVAKIQLKLDIPSLIKGGQFIEGKRFEMGFYRSDGQTKPGLFERILAPENWLAILHYNPEIDAFSVTVSAGYLQKTPLETVIPFCAEEVICKNEIPLSLEIRMPKRAPPAYNPGTESSLTSAFQALRAADGSLTSLRILLVDLRINRALIYLNASITDKSMRSVIPEQRGRWMVNVYDNVLIDFTDAIIDPWLISSNESGSTKYDSPVKLVIARRIPSTDDDIQTTKLLSEGYSYEIFWLEHKGEQLLIGQGFVRAPLPETSADLKELQGYALDGDILSQIPSPETVETAAEETSIDSKDLPVFKVVTSARMYYDGRGLWNVYAPVRVRNCLICMTRHGEAFKMNPLGRFIFTDKKSKTMTFGETRVKATVGIRIFFVSDFSALIYQPIIQSEGDQYLSPAVFARRTTTVDASGNRYPHKKITSREFVEIMDTISDFCTQ